MGNCAVVGINWGDEGKGRIVDLLSGSFGAVVRFQGGGNAGHTVVNGMGSFALHLLPSGIFRSGVLNVLGCGTAFDPENLLEEIRSLRAKGVAVSPENLLVSDRASVLMPWHRELDALEEERLGDKRYGSTRQGIAPFYSDKYQKKTIQAGELFYPDLLGRHIAELTEWKNRILKGAYGAREYDPGEVAEWVHRCCAPLMPYIGDAARRVERAVSPGRGILFEGQLGALRDIDHGIFPYTTSSHTLASYAPIGSGLPTEKIDAIIGVVKAYSTCVGEGPFVCEMAGEEAQALRAAGREYGAKTGRPRRVGPFDAVATRYGARLQGATQAAVTKLDVLSYMDAIPVCTRYAAAGKTTDRFPFPAALDGAKPVIEYMDGWKEDISRVRTWAGLPGAARAYVEMIEEAVGCPVTMISVGPERDSVILR